MPARPGRWCGKCRTVHAGDCPERNVWEKPLHVKSGRGGRPWRRLRKQIFERDGYLCQECLRQGVLTIVTEHGSRAGICDHIVALSAGGKDHPSNLQTLCRDCSDAKTHREALEARGGSKV
ncbi:nuclease [Alcanivorax xiamenensis]|uniref:Nuclease n=1 Tax=Alcanivorax xiamenensis TaxID=1177156 RepID=A0ABQ6Y6S8_9GAMM|nr:nuclease [Alcanivorax xiamenensis]